MAYIAWREDDLWTAQSLDTDVASQGETRDEAINNLQEALNLHFEGTKEEPVTRQEPIFGEFEILKHA